MLNLKPELDEFVTGNSRQSVSVDGLDRNVSLYMSDDNRRLTLTVDAPSDIALRLMADLMTINGIDVDHNVEQIRVKR